jgi:alpha,alpha-trehalase
MCIIPAPTSPAATTAESEVRRARDRERGSRQHAELAAADLPHRRRAVVPARRGRDPRLPAGTRPAHGPAAARDPLSRRRGPDHALEERRIVSMADPHLAGSRRLTRGELVGRSSPSARPSTAASSTTASRATASSPAAISTSWAGSSRRRHAVPALPHEPVAHRGGDGGAHAASGRDGDRRGAERKIGSDRIWQDLSCAVAQGARITVEKIVALHDSRDWAIAEAGLEAKRTLAHAGGFREPAGRPRRSPGVICGRIATSSSTDGTMAETELKLRLHIFHSCRRPRRIRSISTPAFPRAAGTARPIAGTSSGTSLFIFPFLSLRLPTLTRALLRYRYRRLPEARRAREGGLRGRDVPLAERQQRREETQHLHLNRNPGAGFPTTPSPAPHQRGHRLQHLAVPPGHRRPRVPLHLRRGDVPRDRRFWVSMATYNPEIDRYEIKGVMGPDEYHTAYPGRRSREWRARQQRLYQRHGLLDPDAGRGRHRLLPESQARAHLRAHRAARDDLRNGTRSAASCACPSTRDGVISQFEGYDAEGVRLGGLSREIRRHPPPRPHPRSEATT